MTSGCQRRPESPRAGPLQPQRQSSTAEPLGDHSVYPPHHGQSGVPMLPPFNPDVGFRERLRAQQEAAHTVHRMAPALGGLSWGSGTTSELRQTKLVRGMALINSCGMESFLRQVHYQN